jgi:hypothetical protein
MTSKRLNRRKSLKKGRKSLKKSRRSGGKKIKSVRRNNRNRKYAKFGMTVQEKNTLLNSINGNFANIEYSCMEQCIKDGKVKADNLRETVKKEAEKQRLEQEEKQRLEQEEKQRQEKKKADDDIKNKVDIKNKADFCIEEFRKCMTPIYTNNIIDMDTRAEIKKNVENLMFNLDQLVLQKIKAQQKNPFRS